ncbi:competence/damage-inducible protein A [candidate division KSB1 bacterium]|nr:competence/damage-inducible protein A [candidate division KSB1 bacterium]RQW05149.1 MAG: competence/damage-inducible protein A [candidate division KSB1 bacterium]
MRVEVISIGDELLIGQTVNTNASWIGEQLINIGIQLRWVTTVGDSTQDITQALHIAESRSDVALITGGLGPTHDDVTKKVVSDYFGATLVMNEEILDAIKERFRKRRFKMAKVNEEQARVPDNAELLKNDRGTAPGMIFRKDGKSFYVMPGVPHEMKGMMQSHILPELGKHAGAAIRIKNFMTTGVPESLLYERLDNLHEIERYVRLAFLPNLFGVKIRIMAFADNEKVASDKLEQAEKLVRAKIGRDIFADKDISLEEKIAEILIKRGETLAVAESCTGGMISNRLTNIAGSSSFFERGVISYSNAAKVELLGVPEGLILEHGAVSAQVALAMAEGVQRLAGTDYGLSVTGIAGPSGGTAEKPVGLVFVGYADANSSTFEKFTFANDRIGNKQRSVQAALHLLRKQILNRDQDG